MTASTFPYGYESKCNNQIDLCTMIAYDKQNCTKLFIMRCVLQNNIAMIARTFPHDYQYLQQSDAIGTTIAYDKQYCTKLFIMRCVRQNNIAMTASTFSHSYLVQHQIAICTIAYDKQYCTNVGVYRKITLQLLQVHSHMVISVVQQIAL